LSSPEILHSLISRAEANFGRQRTEELRADLEQVSVDLAELFDAVVDFDDEP